MTLKEQLEDDTYSVADALKDANMLSLVSLSRALCKDVAKWLRDQPRDIDEEGTPDPLDDEAAEALEDAVAKLDDAEDLLLGAGWQYP
jgi:hypothetical protein